MKIRVFIADDHGILRSGLRAFLDSQSDMTVVGEAANGEDAERGIFETRPDVALIDIGMPGSGGLATVTAIRGRRLKTRCLVMTAHNELGYFSAATDAGAAGFVVKTAMDTELLGAIRAVAQGRTFVDSSASFRRTHRSQGDARRADGGARRLTPRERAVLARVAAGFTNGEIAGQLGVSTKSVETYRSRVMEKLGMTKRSDLVRFALESGILPPAKSSDE